MRKALRFSATALVVLAVAAFTLAPLGCRSDHDGPAGEHPTGTQHQAEPEHPTSSEHPQ